MIKVENLTKSFGELEVLKGINQEIKDGEVVVVIGPSGSGKHMLFRKTSFFNHWYSLTLRQIIRRILRCREARQMHRIQFQILHRFRYYLTEYHLHFHHLH